MRRIAVILFCWLFLTGLLPAQQAFVCEGQFFLTLTNDAQSGLVEVGIDPDDLSVTFDPLFPALGDYINAIGYSSTEHLIYGVNMTTQELIRIDGVGQVTVLADLPMNSNYLYPAGDISPDGRYLWISGGTGAALTGKDKELIRVDLATPGYPATVFPIGGVEVRMLDLAFDPLTGILYGFDAYQARLVVIDPTTAVVSTPFPSAWGVTSTVGSLFFDAFGRLFGYGNDGMGTQNTLFFIDKLTGQVVPQGIGPAASNTDACSCPYTVALSKAAMPRQVYPCEEIRYTYYLANGAGYDQQGLRLRDTFPAGFEVVEIVHQPPGGSWQSSLGTELVDLVDFSLHPGIDSLVLQVRVPPGAEGAYPTQAHLTGLPPVLGLERFSDDP
ncbi:MAG: hypothetical protein KDC54_20255, partial [Lewinella sp.]|nr:hypothetical protein [Lewinella sp.]